MQIDTTPTNIKSQKNTSALQDEWKKGSREGRKGGKEIPWR
jgi:hypothetical protein